MKSVIAITCIALLAGCGSMNMRSGSSTSGTSGVRTSDAGSGMSSQYDQGMTDQNKIFNMWVGGQ